MNILTRLSKVEQSLLRSLEDEERLEEVSTRWAETAGRLAAQFVNVIQQARAELAARIKATSQHEQAAGAQAIEEATLTSTEYGPEAMGLTRRPSARAQTPTSHRVEATSAAIRAWAREHNMTIGDRGTIPKRIVEAYGRAHAS